MLDTRTRATRGAALVSRGTGAQSHVANSAAEKQLTWNVSRSLSRDKTDSPSYLTPAFRIATARDSARTCASSSAFTRAPGFDRSAISNVMGACAGNRALSSSSACAFLTVPITSLPCSRQCNMRSIPKPRLTPVTRMRFAVKSVLRRNGVPAAYPNNCQPSQGTVKARRQTKPDAQPSSRSGTVQPVGAAAISLYP